MSIIAIISKKWIRHVGQRGNMNHRDCFSRILACQTANWIPNYELGCWAQTVARWRQEGLPSDSNVGKNNMFDGEPFFGIDKRSFARLDITMIPKYEYEIFEETDRYLTARHRNGIVTKALKEGSLDGTRMSMDTYIDFPVKDRASWREVQKRYDPTDPARYPPDWQEKITAWRNRDYPLCLLDNGSFGLYSQLRSWVGTENISYMFYDQPALVEEMLEFNTDFLLALIEPALKDIEYDYFNFFEDCAGKSTPLFGPNIFNRFFMKHYRRIIDRLERAGIKSFWVDSDGDPEVLVPLWMDAGINCFWPLEQASDMDPVRLRKKYGNHLALCGGIDKRKIAAGKKSIEDELNAKIPAMLESGGYIPHIDHAIPPDISYSDFLYYLEIKRKLIGR